MSNLPDSFNQTLLKIGINGIQHPIFYNATISIRFEIGQNVPVYLKVGNDYKTNPDYIQSALNRVKKIYAHLPSSPNILRIDVYPYESCGGQESINMICRHALLPPPHQQRLESFPGNDEMLITQLQLYWDLTKLNLNADRLFTEIIKSDIGGHSGYASNVFLIDSHNTLLFHLYDDRGLDIAAADLETLRPLYTHYNDWILVNAKEKTTGLFEP